MLAMPAQRRDGLRPLLNCDADRRLIRAISAPRVGIGFISTITTIDGWHRRFNVMAPTSRIGIRLSGEPGGILTLSSSSGLTRGSLRLRTAPGRADFRGATNARVEPGHDGLGEFRPQPNLNLMRMRTSRAMTFGLSVKGKGGWYYSRRSRGPTPRTEQSKVGRAHSRHIAIDTCRGTDADLPS
jgi:hypothetical protein